MAGQFREHLRHAARGAAGDPRRGSIGQKNTPTEPVGRIFDSGQEAKVGILAWTFRRRRGTAGSALPRPPRHQRGKEDT